MHEPLWPRLSNLNPVRYANLKDIRSPVENIELVAGRVLSSTTSGAAKRESHSSTQF